MNLTTRQDILQGMHVPNTVFNNTREQTHTEDFSHTHTSLLNERDEYQQVVLFFIYFDSKTNLRDVLSLECF